MLKLSGPMRALKLIDDEHGYIRPGDPFYPGFKHDPLSGKPVSQFHSDPYSLRQQLLRNYVACEMRT